MELRVAARSRPAANEPPRVAKARQGARGRDRRVDGTANPLSRLQLAQERIDLEAELAGSAVGETDRSNLEAEFIASPAPTAVARHQRCERQKLNRAR